MRPCAGLYCTYYNKDSTFLLFISSYNPFLKWYVQFTTVLLKNFPDHKNCDWRIASAETMNNPSRIKHFSELKNDCIFYIIDQIKG